MNRWLYLALGCLVGVVIAVGVIVVVADGGGETPQGSSSPGGPADGGGAVQEPPPEIAEVKAAVVAFRRALQGAGGNPCELMTPEGRVGLYGFYMETPPEATDECAAAALETTITPYIGQREIAADTETLVVVRGRQAVALERGGVLPLFLDRTSGRWLIADDDEVSDTQALVEALERGEGQ